jgi:hypothetical protein
MALDFPSNTSAPYIDPVSGLKYIFNASVGGWEAAIQPPAVVSDTAPTITIPGFLWWDSENGSLYVYYQDENSSQWVEAAPSGAASAVARVSAAAPTSPNDGEIWWDTTSGNLYIYYNDGNSQQWIQATNYGQSDGLYTSGTTTTSGVAAPSTANANDLWYNTTDKTLYINYKTGSNANWVKIHDIASTLAVTSITGTAPVVVTAGTTPTISVNAATETTSGVVKIAAVIDSTESSQNHVLTPRVLSESISSYLPDASSTVKGIVELATQAEVIDGTLSNKAVTPLVLKQSLPQITNVPIGGIIQYGAPTTPTGYLKCDGALVSRVTYAALFQVIGTAYGIGDGATTFKLPTIAGTPISCIKY